MTSSAYAPPDRASDPAGAFLPAGRAVALVVALLLVQMLDGMDVNALPFVGALVRKELGLTGAMLGASIGAAFLGLAVGAVLFGFVADRIGRKAALMLVIGLFGVGSLATVLATGVGALVAIRFLTGTALGGLVPISSAIIIGSVAPAARTTAVTVVVSGTAGGALFAGLALSLAVPAHGWRAMFVIGGLAPLLLLPIVWAIVPADRRGIAATSTTAHAPGEPVAGAATLFGGDAWRATAGFWVAMFLVGVAAFVPVGWLPTLVADAGGSPKQAALAASLFAVGGAVGGVIAGLLTDRLGLRVMLGTAVAAAVALVALGFDIGTGSTALVAGVAGFFTLGLLTLLTALVGQHYAGPVRGRGVGAALGVSRTAAAIAPWAAGRLLDLGAPNSLLFVVSGVAAALGAAVFAPAFRLGTGAPGALADGAVGRSVREGSR